MKKSSHTGKRAAAYVLLAAATLYTLFCVALIFVGCFTTSTVFPHDPHAVKAQVFVFFSFGVLVATWLGGCFLYGDSDEESA